MRRDREREAENHLKKKRSALGKTAGVVGVAVNLFLAVGKIVTGSLANSVSILADGLNNLSDAGSSVIAFLGFKLSEKPADKEHPYGHARYEYLMGLLVSVMVMVIGAELLKTSGRKLFYPEKTEFSYLTAGILSVSMMIKLWLSFYHKKIGEKIGSKTLKAAAEDSRNDVFVTGGVLLSGLIEFFTEVQTDALTGIPLGGFILFNGWKLAGETVSPILGEGADEELRRDVEAFVRSYEKILDCHDFMLHDYGPEKRYGSIHLEMDRAIGSMESHEIIDRIEKDILQRFGIEMVIHHDPIATDDRELTEAKNPVETLLRFRDKTISVHDFRMERKEGHTVLSFNLVLPRELFEKADEVKADLDLALNRIGEEVYLTKVTFDREHGGH